MKVEAPCSCTMKILGFLFLIVVPCRKKEEKKKAFLCVISCPTFPGVYLWWLLKQKPRSISPSPKANKNPKLKSQNILRRLRHEPRGCHGNSQKGYESALTKCVNSLPPKRSSVFSMFLLCDIRSFEDCGEVVVGGGKVCVVYFLFYFFFFCKPFAMFN